MDFEQNIISRYSRFQTQHVDDDKGWDDDQAISKNAKRNRQPSRDVHFVDTRIRIPQRIRR